MLVVVGVLLFFRCGIFAEEFHDNRKSFSNLNTIEGAADVKRISVADLRKMLI